MLVSLGYLVLLTLRQNVTLKLSQAKLTSDELSLVKVSQYNVERQVSFFRCKLKMMSFRGQAKWAKMTSCGGKLTALMCHPKKSKQS
jgi:hypothetical protein